MAQLSKLLGMPESRRTYEESRLLALKKCNTGLEFEAENVKVDLPLEDEEAGFWISKEDGSLRGNGREFVLREPLFGEDLVKSVNWLCSWATKHRFESNYRTGLHVHIDVRNLDTEHLLSMVIYYSLFEKVIFNWVGDDREGSNFCMPMYKAAGVLDQIAKALRAENRMKEAAKAIDRYAAFNLNSLSKFGTVEWRHLQTTFNSERVLDWINVCQGFKKYAKSNPLRPNELLAMVSKGGPKEIFSEIVGAPLANKMWTIASDRDVWGYGIPVAQQLVILLEGAGGLGWDNVRSVLGSGTSPRWNKWVEKNKKSSALNKAPENPFADPALLTDRELQRIAVDDLSRRLREALSTVVIN